MATVHWIGQSSVEREGEICEMEVNYRCIILQKELESSSPQSSSTCSNNLRTGHSSLDTARKRSAVACSMLSLAAASIQEHLLTRVASDRANTVYTYSIHMCYSYFIL